ncbi:hypothetical protein V1478_006536 [Vespula squamosa]|uniref:Uncharacterized protein n=1 Tax=Vespula squamosa TaxID=30214 RepID=A0ABD2B852_VESSQ
MATTLKCPTLQQIAIKGEDINISVAGNIYFVRILAFNHKNVMYHVYDISDKVLRTCVEFISNDYNVSTIDVTEGTKATIKVLAYDHQKQKSVSYVGHSGEYLTIRKIPFKFYKNLDGDPYPVSCYPKKFTSRDTNIRGGRKLESSGSLISTDTSCPMVELSNDEISHASLGLLRLVAKNKQTFKADETTITTTTTTSTSIVNDYYGIKLVQCVVKSIGLWLGLGWPSQGGPDWVGRAHGNRP